MSEEEDHEASGSGVGPAAAGVQQDNLNPQLVNQVFGLFKGYLSTQLDLQSKQLEGKSKIAKEATEFKFKGNRKQFELNSQLDNILTQIGDKSHNPVEVRKLAADWQKNE